MYDLQSVRVGHLDPCPVTVCVCVMKLPLKSITRFLSSFQPATSFVTGQTLLLSKCLTFNWVLRWFFAWLWVSGHSWISMASYKCDFYANSNFYSLSFPFFSLSFSFFSCPILCFFTESPIKREKERENTRHLGKFRWYFILMSSAWNGPDWTTRVSWSFYVSMEITMKRMAMEERKRMVSVEKKRSNLARARPGRAALVLSWFRDREPSVRGYCVALKSVLQISAQWTWAYGEAVFLWPDVKRELYSHCPIYYTVWRSHLMDAKAEREREKEKIWALKCRPWKRPALSKWLPRWQLICGMKSHANSSNKLRTLRDERLSLLSVHAECRHLIKVGRVMPSETTNKRESERERERGTKK